jgi:hypothetical protein
MADRGSNFDSLQEELMVLVRENGSGLPSLPSRRWLCADTSAVFQMMFIRG